MNSGLLIGTLAAFTIGTVLLAAVGYFGLFLRNPKNHFQFARILAGGESASTVAARSDPSVSSAPLKTRLDQSIASSHPDDPGHEQTRDKRTEKVKSERATR